MSPKPFREQLEELQQQASQRALEEVLSRMTHLLPPQAPETPAELPSEPPLDISTLLNMQQQVTPQLPQAFAPFVSQPSPIEQVAAPIMPMPAIQAKPQIKSGEEKISVPFWQKALQVFAAPFVWVEENLIKPGLALAGTQAGFVPQVERQPGEDFWEWKKRSWAGWEAPGIHIKLPWSDEPWRVDMKGVMELAPWLLIPGAGQVGTGVRAARGIAGVLGKLGPAGRVLGTAVEYSPWGLVEKTAGVAIKGGFRTVGNVSERVSTKIGEKFFGKYVPPPTPPEITKLADYMKAVVMPTYRAFRKEIPGLRARQETAIRKLYTQYNAKEITLAQLRAQETKVLEGGVKAGFALTPEAMATRQAEAIAKIEARVATKEISSATGKALITKIKSSSAFQAIPFTSVEVKSMRDMITSSAESGLVRQDSARAFDRFLLNGELPMRHNLRDWAQVFGDDFARAVGQLRTLPPDKVSQFVDTLNIGRSLQASLDISGTGRQGLILSLLHPTQAPKWFWRQLKALISEKWTLEMDDAMRAHPQFNKIIAETGAYIAPARQATFASAEELFASRAARRIPGIRRSERAFLTYLNQGRWTSLLDGYNTMTAQGATAAELKLFGRFINLASGRGEIPKSLEKFAPVLNGLLFSPKLQASILQLPRQLGRMLLSSNPYMRKEAAKALVTFVGGGASLLGLFHATGISKVELDPRSGDFGKIKIGETRLDIWRGYLQYARFVAQMLTGERKSAYGNMNKAERGEIAWRFLQSKGSPAFGLMVDVLRGETYMGKPIFQDTTGFSYAVKERVLPLAMQDVIDAMEQSGINGLWVAAPATLGVGALTIVNNVVRVQERIAREQGYDSWDDIDPKTQREIQNRNAELQATYIELDRQVMGTAWGDWRLAGQAIEEGFKDNVNKAVAQYRATGDGVQFREKVGDAFTARRGAYDAREREARFEDIVRRLKIDDPAQALVELGPEQLAIKAYNDALWGDDMYDEFGDYRFDEAEARKQVLRQQLGQELFDYVEEYRALKYENFPPEFQELAKAKTILRPYWQIQTDIISMFGQSYADSSWGQRMITKLRQNMRLSTSELNEAYMRFYSRQQ